MGLKISQFWNFQPTLPFRFKVEIFDAGTSIFTYFVQKVELPILEAGEGDNTIFLGNGIMTIPVFTPAKRTLKITFEESNRLSVIKYIDNLMANAWKGLVKIVPIGITQYKADMKTEEWKRTFLLQNKKL